MIRLFVTYFIQTNKWIILPSMREATQTERVIALLARKGILRPIDLDAIGIPRVVLTRLAASGMVDRIGRGLYRLPGHSVSEYESLVIVAAKVPQAVFCLLTALQFHGLTTQLPRHVWVAMPRGSHSPKIDYPPIRMVQMTANAYATGIEEHLIDGMKLQVYSAAKTVVDCFKHRNKIGLDVALEALKDAWRTRKASAEDLWRHAQACRVANVMRPYLDVVAHS